MSETHLTLTQSQFVSRHSRYSPFAPRFKRLFQKHFFIFAKQMLTSRLETPVSFVLTLHFHHRPETDLNPRMHLKCLIEPCPTWWGRAAASFNYNLVYMELFLFGKRSSSAAWTYNNITTTTQVHRDCRFSLQPYLVPPSSSFRGSCQFPEQRP